MGGAVGFGEAWRQGNRPRPDHMGNFLECVRSRKQPNANVEDGYRAVTVTELAQKSYRVQKMIVFDYQYLNLFGHCTDGPRSEEDERIRHG